MKFACPGCGVEMSANPPRPGRFTLKCPHCGVGCAVKLSVLTLAAEKEGVRAAREKSLTAVAQSPPADHDQTVTAPRPAVPREPADPDRTAPTLQAPLDREDTEATRGNLPRPDRSDHTVVSVEQSRPPQATADADIDMPDGEFRGYELLKPLGKGGMGSVFLARQVSLDRSVALKTLNPEWASDPVLISRFVREAYAAAQLTHHNVVQIYELGREGAVNYFSMEYVHGGSLGDRLRDGGKLTADEAVGFVVQAAGGLRYAHDRGMVHRDIKPDNLMVNDEGVVKVADLGLVKTRGVSPEEDAAGARSKRTGSGSGSGSGLGSLPDVTRVGSVMGSPSYMAPEQCRDATAVDARADVYSLGCTLYALLSGRAPFQAKTAVELIQKHLSEPPPPLARTAPDVHTDLAKIVERSLAKDPADRYQSMTEFTAALKQWQEANGKSVGRPSEEQLAVFEGLVKQVANEPLGKLTVRVATFGPLLGLLTGVVTLFLNPVAGGIILLGALAALVSGFVAGGLLTGSPLFRKAREWAFGARISDWLTVAAAVFLFLGGLYFSGLVLYGLIGLALGVGVGVGWAYALARPAHDKAMVAKDDLESLVKRWRLAGMDEDDIRQFVVENAGDRWERVYELLYGYPAMVLARTQYTEKVATRPKYAGWRDGLIARLDATIRKRADTRAKKLLRQTEAARLKAAGVSNAEAEALADDAAEDVVEQGRSILAANADASKKVNVREMMSRYEMAKSIPRRPRTPLAVRVIKKVAGLPFDPRLRLVVGALLVVGTLMWVNQNTAGGVERLKDVGSGEQASASAGSLWEQVQPLVMAPEKAKPLVIGWLPAEVTAFFDSLNPLVAGLLVLLSALSSRTRTVLAVAFAAAVAFAGHKVGIPIPEVGPLKPSHLTALGGLALGLLGFVVLGRK